METFEMDRRKTDIDRVEACKLIDKTNKMLLRIIQATLIIIAVLIVLLAGTNMAWLYVANQYEYEYIKVDSGCSGNANYIGESGVIINGESDRD